MSGDDRSGEHEDEHEDEDVAAGTGLPGECRPSRRAGELPAPARPARRPTELHLDDLFAPAGDGGVREGDEVVGAHLDPLGLHRRGSGPVRSRSDDDDRFGGLGDEMAARRAAGAHRVQVALAWFPASEWAEAQQRWPDLAGYNPADHQEYCRTMEGRAKLLARRLGEVPAISPLHIAELEAFAAERLLPADSGEARSGLAAEVARTGRAVVWPPGRNDPCWCGSGVKYKACCADAPEVDH